MQVFNISNSTATKTFENTWLLRKNKTNINKTKKMAKIQKIYFDYPSYQVIAGFLHKSMILNSW